MTKQEAIKLLKAKLACMERESRGTDENCNKQNCMNCDLNYKQGTMGDQMEVLQMAIDVLDKDIHVPCNDTISRQAAIDVIEHRLAEPAYQHTGEDWYTGMNCAESELYDLPPAQPDIIRCRDCRFWQDQEEGVVEVPICARPENRHEKYLFRFIVGADGYCSFAERRTDDN